MTTPGRDQQQKASACPGCGHPARSHYAGVTAEGGEFRCWWAGCKCKEHVPGFDIYGERVA